MASIYLHLILRVSILAEINHLIMHVAHLFHQAINILKLSSISKTCIISESTVD